MNQATARLLPDEFLAVSGNTIERTLAVVAHHWGSLPISEQRQLAQALIGLLEPLLTAPGGAVSETLRDECAQAVSLWESQLPVGAPRRSGASAAKPRGKKKRAPRAVKFVRAALERLPEERCRARVELARETGEAYVGVAETPWTEEETVWCTARATAQAIEQAIGEAAGAVAIDRAAVSEALGKRAVFVQVTVRKGGESSQLMGICRNDEDPTRAAALAVLNATNRVLDLS
jgi:hypothetical protein